MDIPEKIRTAAARLKNGQRVNRVTVRDFLGHFGVARRGATKVEQIRQILDELQIKTEPDFATVWIEEPIWLRLKEDGTSVHAAGEAPDSSSANTDGIASEEIILEGTPSAVKQALAQSEAAPTSEEPDITSRSDDVETTDPTFRIGSLPEANKALVSVSQDDTITKAITLMLQHDFSQLPVMQGEREVKGVITWKSICSRMAMGLSCDRVADCREDARIVDANRTLFDVIPTIVEYGYVLVRQQNRKISGLVTASDLSVQFHSLTEPFLLLREIELHVRRLMGGKLSPSDLSSAVFPYSSGAPQSITDLSFGDYVRLFQNPQIWEKLNLRIDKSQMTALLERVRLIRNDVMHFDPDPLEEEERTTLKSAVRLMQQLYDLRQ